MKKYLKLIRVKHWLKNFLIFVPIVCGNVLNYENLFVTLGGFFSFSFMCSFIYIVNDIRDIEKDRLHPRKKLRPLASGEISKNQGILIAIVLAILSLIINFIIIKNSCYSTFVFLIVYMVINLLYSMGLKNYPVVDVCILATGFVLRIYYGASLIGIPVSNWLFLTVMSAALFLGLGKRKKEYLNNKDARKVLSEYNEEFLTNFQYLCLCLTLVFYSLWTLEQGNEYLIYTVPILIIIFMKYCLIMEKSDEGDPTTILYNDKLLLGLCALYGIVMVILLVVI